MRTAQVGDHALTQSGDEEESRGRRHGQHQGHRAQAEEGGATTLRGVLSTAALIGGLGPSFGQGG